MARSVMAATERPSSQVKLKLATSQSDIALPDTTPPILVNTSLRRLGLSTLVNHLLESQKPIPFEFLINGAFLRTSIEDYLTANGISAESLLTVEYVRANMPYAHAASFEHDNWVLSVDVLSRTSRACAGIEAQAPLPGQERILSATTDGFVRIWNMSGQLAAISPGREHGGHYLSIKSAKFIDPSRVASGGFDRAVRIWNFQDSQQSLETTSKLTPELELWGHGKGINTIDVHTPSSKLLTASDDMTLGLWSTQASDGPEAPENMLPMAPRSKSKRQKLSAEPTPRRGPLSILEGHKKLATAAIFAPNDHTVAYSVSYDGALRTWDLTTSLQVDARISMNTLVSVEALPDLSLIAVGNTERYVSIIDPRASATKSSVMTLRPHRNKIVSLQRDPNNQYRLLSGSHDGACRIWDLRSTRQTPQGPVGELVDLVKRSWVKPGEWPEAGDGVKVFEAVWDKEIGIVSGSADKMVQINRDTSTTSSSEVSITATK